MSARAPEPRGRPACSPVAVVTAACLVLVGVALVLDAVLPAAGSQRSQVREALVRLDGLTPGAATTAAGAVAVVLGVLLVVAALRPRPRTHVPVRAEADLWVTPRAVGALGAETAEREPTVLQAEVGRATRRRVTLWVTPRSLGNATIEAHVAEAVQRGLAVVDGAPVSIRIKEET